jgi:hypothetical protein
MLTSEDVVSVRMNSNAWSKVARRGAVKLATPLLATVSAQIAPGDLGLSVQAESKPTMHVVTGTWL